MWSKGLRKISLKSSDASYARIYSADALVQDCVVQRKNDSLDLARA